tara:strand:+ start:446 stop:1036 length:591 start_codon:yes stop_codon:yes gene_type:complete
MFKAELDFKKNPTQGNFILEFIKDNPNLENTSSKTISALLPEFTAKPTKKEKNPMPKKIPESTVRARLSEFQKLNIVSNDSGQFSIKENWHKKLLKTGTTKDPKKNTKAYIEIYTFENNNDYRYQSLLNAAFNGLLGDLDSIDEAGYSSEQVSATDIETLYVTDFSMDNSDGSWGNLKVDEWANKTDTGRVELYEA